jgi:hypothetical protein
MRRRSVITTVIFRATIVFGATAAAGDAWARLDVYVDKSTQRMQVMQNGSLLYVWPVSTGRDRFSTPSGVYTPERLERSWFSKAYYNAPMPHAIFFHNGYAIHGSYDIARLGGPASHGCIRLHPRNAALLFSMVQQEGPGSTTIFVGGNSHRPPLRYRDDDEPWRPAWRGDTPAARDYPPEPRTGPRGPAGDRMPPGEGPGRYVERGGGYPPPGPEVEYYVPDRYGSPDRYDSPDRYSGQGGYSRAPDAAPYDDADRYVDPRRAPRGPRVAPGYDSDPYVDGRSPPRGPGYSPYYPDRRSDARSANPHGAKAPPYDADRYADGPAQRRNDAGPSPLAMRGGEPASRLPAPRYDGQAPVGRTAPERTPVERMTTGRAPVERIPLPRSFRPVATGAKPRYVRPADEPPDHYPAAGDAAQALPPMPPSVLPPTAVLPPTSALPPVVPPAPTPAVSSPPAAPAPAARQDLPPEPQESGFGYKILPRSYWAGASWRWRLKREDDGAPPAASQ